MAITVPFAGGIGTRALDATSGDQFTLTTTQTADAGDRVVLGHGWVGSNQLITGITDNSGLGLTWTIDKQGSSASKGSAIASVYCPAGLPSGTVITIAQTGSGAVTVAAGATILRGTKSSSYIDGTPTGLTILATQNWATASYTIIADSCLVGSCFTDVFGASHAAQAGSTEAFEALDVADSYGQAMVYRIEGTGGAFTAGGTWSGTGTSQNVGVAYLAAAAATQAFRPDADIVTTGWTATPLWSKIEEEVADGTIITATAS